MNTGNRDVSRLSLDAVECFAHEAAPRDVCEQVSALESHHNRWHDDALNLVASHNVLSPRAMAMLNSGFADKIQSGTIGLRAHSGSEWTDRLDVLAAGLAKRLFCVSYAEVRAASGSVANALAILGALHRGDTVLVVDSQNGGHKSYLKQGFGRSLDLRFAAIPHDGADDIDVAATAEIAARVKPHWIVLGTSRPLFPEPFAALCAIARNVGARVYYDAAHTLGLIAGRQFDDPVASGIELVVGSTQKTLPGPIGGLVLSNDPETSAEILGSTNTLISNYGNARVAALAITLAEMIEFGVPYAQAVTTNAQTLAQALAANGFAVIGKEKGFTRSHVVMLDLKSEEATREAFARLERASITCSKMPIARDYPRVTALRLGVCGATRVGMQPEDMRVAAELMRRVVIEGENSAVVQKDVTELASGFRRVRYCFD